MIIRCAPRVSYSHLFLTQQPCASKEKRKKIRHDYRSVLPEYEEMTTERLFAECHVATGSFFIDHNRFAQEGERFNDVTIGGKPVWQKKPSGHSTLHNSIAIAEHFPSLAPLLIPLEALCKPRPGTARRFKKQRAQQYTKSGRRHRDGKNAEWRMCITVHDPAALSLFKELEIGVADASKVKDVDAIAMGTAGALEANAGCESAPVPPPYPEQIGVSSGSQQTSDWHKLQKQENLECYTDDQRAKGE
ncbi:unnamed protein product [Ectocarpus sp. CCAP 1310/34]|nr:unnamed protein product [Ectocarpus sp. CCAP 1310/34]